MSRITIIYSSILISLLTISSCAINTAVVPNLATITQSELWTAHNRKASYIMNSGQGSVYFETNPLTGVVWSKDLVIGDGVIEVDMKGKDVKDKSYLGIAFRGQDENTYEAVYFRPFNFNASDPIRKNHAVQYEAEPNFPWDKLRKEQPEKYEHFLTPSVNPNEFFHVKILLDKSHIRVYVNGSAEPTLAVDSLSTQKSGWVGFWIGKNADATFKNLKVIPVNM